MKNIFTYMLGIAAAAVMTFGSTAQADHPTFHARARLQGTTAVEGFGVNGVVELPALSDSPGDVMALTGLAHVDGDRKLSLNLGGVVMDGDARAILDARGAIPLTDSLDAWVNLRWTGFDDPDSSDVYGFAMVDVTLPGKFSFASLGIESENLITSNSEDFSYGPNLLVKPTKSVGFQTSYQVHTNAGHQAWLRLVVDLP
jgi:hypothetical protein